MKMKSFVSISLPYVWMKQEQESQTRENMIEKLCTFHSAIDWRNSKKSSRARIRPHSLLWVTRSFSIPNQTHRDVFHLLIVSALSLCISHSLSLSLSTKFVWARHLFNGLEHNFEMCAIVLFDRMIITLRRVCKAERNNFNHLWGSFDWTNKQ